MKGLHMERQLKGIAVILLSILLIIGFDSIDRSWSTYVFDLDLHWATVFMLMGIIGFIIVIRTKK